VWSSELPKSTLLAGKGVHHNIYDQAKSDSFKASKGQHWNITYGDGSSASGNVGTDVVNIGGIVVKNQAVEMAKKLSPSFAQGYGKQNLLMLFLSARHMLILSPILCRRRTARTRFRMLPSTSFH
jgi:hypothetical protein